MFHNIIPINHLVRIHEHGLNYPNYTEDEQTFKDIVRNSFYFPNNGDRDTERNMHLMLALAFENLSSMGNDDELVKKNVEVIRNEQEDASGDESKSCDKETKSAHTKFQGAQFKFKSFLRPEVLKRFRMIRLKVGNFKSIYGDIKHTDQDADGINVHFDPLPDSPPINPRISHDVMFLPNQLNLCLGYEALQLIEKFGLTDFFRDFEEEPSGSLRSLSPSFQSPSSPCYNLESPLSSSSESHESTECKAVVQSPSKLIDHFDWINTSIDSNLEQQRAVKNIVNCTAYPFPFVIFGPPGTGKTTVLIEAVAQIIRLKPGSRVLITAQSNSACNEIALRLMNSVGAWQILRFFSPSLFKYDRDEHKIPLELRPISNYQNGFIETKISKLKLHQYSVVITTLVSSDRLKVGMEHIDYIFIDECASATEPEACIPIVKFGTMNSKITANLIFLGDPLQLGPVLNSKMSEKLGLGVSLMERIMTKSRYQLDSQCTDYVVQLLDNYRSHPAILQFSNIKFYGSKLRSKMLASELLWAREWKHLMNKDFPILFHSTNQPSDVDRDGSSYNSAEVVFVMSYVTFLLTQGIGGRQVTVDDIGIVTPYKAQTRLLAKSMENLGIEIGSAEQYQGREKNIMIASTVRSQSLSIGFLNNQKRLNVMMTRAKHLLIIIGNPWTLETDRSWKTLIDYCYLNNAFCGLGYSSGVQMKSSRKIEDSVKPEEKRLRRS